MDGILRARLLKSEAIAKLARAGKALGKRGFKHCLVFAMAALGISATATFDPAGAAFAEKALLPVASESSRTYGQADPTAAWMRFCERVPDECAIDAREPSVVSLNSNVWATIADVNQRVNAMILAVTDQDHWGVVDRWDFPDDGMGDCEDIQLLKRRLLIKAGLPRRAMRMTVVIDELGAGHAVMMVRTDHGDFILDNKRDVVLPWKQTGYVFLKREGTESAAWVMLGEWAAPIVTVNR
jgi:predicted transglutaminase-like cysteine proteinase